MKLRILLKNFILKRHQNVKTNTAKLNYIFY